MPVAVQTRSRQVAYWTGAGPFPRPPRILDADYRAPAALPIWNRWN
jgi:hypothetical protein